MNYLKIFLNLHILQNYLHNICMGGSSPNNNVCMVGVTSNFVGLFEEKAKKKMGGGGVNKNMPPPPPQYSDFWNRPEHIHKYFIKNIFMFS